MALTAHVLDKGSAKWYIMQQMYGVAILFVNSKYCVFQFKLLIPINRAKFEIK